MRWKLYVTGQEVHAGAMLPRFWGVAYWRDYDDIAVCYPVPINLLVGWSRKAYVWMRHVRPSKVELSVRKGWEAGYRNGYRKGRQDEKGRLRENIAEAYEAALQRRQAQLAGAEPGSGSVGEPNGGSGVGSDG